MEYDREFQVYTDNHQCEDFEVPYFGSPATLVIAARDLLASKDYDTSHRAYLSQFGNRVLVMRRTADQSPGWWRVTEVH